MKFDTRIDVPALRLEQGRGQSWRIACNFGHTVAGEKRKRDRTNGFGEELVR